MKLLITENKLIDNFQKLIDRELSKLRARYRNEEISASNWYLSIFSKIDSVKVTDIKNSPTLSVYINVYGDSRLDEDDVLTFTNYLRKKLSVIGNPWIVPTLVGEINEMVDKPKDNVEKIKSLIDKKGVKKVIGLVGGPENFIKMLGYDDIEKYIYQYLEENCYPDYGWESPEYYKEEIERLGEILFTINDYPSYEYNRHYDGGTHIDIINYLYYQLEENFSIDGDNSVWLKVFGKWFKDKTGLRVDRVI